MYPHYRRSSSLPQTPHHPVSSRASHPSRLHSGPKCVTPFRLDLFSPTGGHSSLFGIVTVPGIPLLIICLSLPLNTTDFSLHPPSALRSPQLVHQRGLHHRCGCHLLPRLSTPHDLLLVSSWTRANTTRIVAESGTGANIEKLRVPSALLGLLGKCIMLVYGTVMTGALICTGMITVALTGFARCDRLPRLYQVRKIRSPSHHSADK